MNDVQIPIEIAREILGEFVNNMEANALKRGREWDSAAQSIVSTLIDRFGLNNNVEFISVPKHPNGNTVEEHFALALKESCKFDAIILGDLFVEIKKALGEVETSE